MEFFYINTLKPNQGSIQLSTMKRGGGQPPRTGTNKRVVNQPEPPIIVIDGSKLMLARAELDILRSGRYTSNAEFDKHLGDLGSSLDKTFRSLVPWSVHYDFSQTPSEVIQCIADYFVTNGLCNDYTMKVYLQISWKSEKRQTNNSTNLNNYISTYRCGLWKLYKSFFLRPCTWDTNFALLNWWGHDRTDDIFFGEGELYNSRDPCNHFAYDRVDEDLHEGAWKQYLCDIPDDWDRATGTFVFHAEQTSRNVFKSFLEDIDRCASNMVTLITMITSTLKHKHAACLAFRAEWDAVLSALQQWGVSPFDIKRSFFDIVHMGLSVAAKTDDYVDTKNPEGALFLNPSECMNLKLNGAMVGRSFRDISSLLRRSHVWIFFAFGRSHRNEFWVVNPCGSWAYDPQSGDDYKPSTSPTDWTSKISWTSMGWFVKLGWLIMNNKTPTITLESNYKEDMEKFHCLRPNCVPSPPTESFSELLENMFNEAFVSESSDPLGWFKMLSVLYPFLSFPGGRARTIFKEKHLDTRATARHGIHKVGTASCKCFFCLIIFILLKHCLLFTLLCL
jgi:hypothetical protein